MDTLNLFQSQFNFHCNIIFSFFFFFDAITIGNKMKLRDYVDCIIDYIFIGYRWIRKKLI